MSKYYYVCVNCLAEYEGAGVKYLCEKCQQDNTADMPPKGVLAVRYDYEKIKNGEGKKLFEQLKNNAFIDLLPINKATSLSPLKVGNTPLYHFKSEQLIDTEQSFNVYLKDDALNPTFSLKDRASNLVSAFAKENNIDTIIAASTGNAGSSIAGICASQGQKAIVMVPAKAPKAKLLQIMHYGATIVPVDGTYDDAFELSLKASEMYGYYNRNTAFNPLTIEGKKTVAFEIFEQLKQEIPDYIFVSVGDGVIVSGVYKGFEDLFKLGIINRMPTVIAVQSDKSKNVYANMDDDNFIVYPATTLADSISVDVPRNFFMAKDFIKKYKGHVILVSDDEIINASLALSSKSGIFSEPAASAAYAGLLKFAQTQQIMDDANVVVLLTGAGLKDLKNIESQHQMPNPIKPNLKELESILKKKL